MNLKRYAGKGLSRFASQDEFYRQLLVLALAAGDPLVLYSLGKPLKTRTAGRSWASRLDAPDTGSAPSSHPLPLLSTGSFKIDQNPAARWIEFDGLVLDKSERPPNRWIDIATSIVNRSLKISLGNKT